MVGSVAPMVVLDDLRSDVDRWAQNRMGVIRSFILFLIGLAVNAR